MCGAIGERDDGRVDGGLLIEGFENGLESRRIDEAIAIELLESFGGDGIFVEDGLKKLLFGDRGFAGDGAVERGQAEPDGVTDYGDQEGHHHEGQEDGAAIAHIAAPPASAPFMNCTTVFAR